jgi:predicted phage-related endonuclease
VEFAVIEQRVITDETEWLEWRKQDVTASRVAALFGQHPYETALHLYLEKRGVEFPEPDRDDRILRRGRWLEPAVACAVSEKRPDWQIDAPKLYLRDPALRLGGTPDFFITGDARGKGVLQCKTVAPSVFERDWDNGREVPFWIVLQTITEMMLSGADFGAVAGLLVDAFSMDVAIVEIPRHPPTEERIVRAVSAFWTDVAAGHEPTPDFGRDASAIKAMTARATEGKTFDASGHNELPTILAQRAALMSRIKEAKARCDEIENEVKYLLGDAEIVSNLPDWRITFKPTDFKEYTVKARTARSLRIIDKRPAEERPDGGEDGVAA